MLLMLLIKLLKNKAPNIEPMQGTTRMAQAQLKSEPIFVFSLW